MAACSMLAVRRQRKPCRRFVDVSAARRGRQTTRHGVLLVNVSVCRAGNGEQTARYEDDRSADEDGQSSRQHSRTRARSC